MLDQCTCMVQTARQGDLVVNISVGFASRDYERMNTIATLLRECENKNRSWNKVGRGDKQAQTTDSDIVKVLLSRGKPGRAAPDLDNRPITLVIVPGVPSVASPFCLLCQRWPSSCFLLRRGYRGRGAVAAGPPINSAVPALTCNCGQRFRCFGHAGLQSLAFLFLDLDSLATMGCAGIRCCFLSVPFPWRYGFPAPERIFELGFEVWLYGFLRRPFILAAVASYYC